MMKSLLFRSEEDFLLLYAHTRRGRFKPGNIAIFFRKNRRVSSIQKNIFSFLPLRNEEAFFNLLVQNDQQLLHNHSKCNYSFIHLHLGM